MHLIVGLGNPGKEYAHHRHNAGFMAIDALVEKYRLSGPKSKFESEVYDGEIGGKKIIALKPLTFMNVSGMAVKQAADFYKIGLENIIVIHDELDLDPGELKIKTGGGSAGHNGLRSIDAHLGNDYKRLRIGIGHPGHKDLVTAFVLHDFSREERTLMDEMIHRIVDDFDLLLDHQHENFLRKVEQ